MGIYTYTDPYTGQVFNFEHAGDRPTDEDLSFMQQHVQSERARVSSVLGTEYGDGTAFGRGWQRGVAGAKGGLGELAESMGQGTGWGWLEGLGSNMEEAARIREAELGAQYGAPTALEDVKGLGSGLTWLGELAGGSAPYMVGGAVGAGVGAAASPFLGIGAGTAATLGGAAALFPTYVGENIQSREENVGEDNLTRGDYLKATATGAFQAALDVASLNVLARLGVGRPVLEALQGQVGQGFTRRLLTGAGTGMATEGSTEALQELAGMWQAGDDLSSPEAQRRLAEAFIGGGLLGGVLGGAGRGVFGARPEVSQEANGNGEEAPPAPAGPTLQEGQTQGELFDDLPTQGPPAAPTIAQQLELPLVGEQGPVQEQLEMDLEAPVGAQGDLFGRTPSVATTQTRMAKDVLDDLGIPATAPIRRRLKDVTADDPRVTEQLTKFARTPMVPVPMRNAVNDYLAALKEAAPAPAETTTPMPVPAGPQTQVEQAVEQTKKTAAKTKKVAEQTLDALDPTEISVLKVLLERKGKKAKLATIPEELGLSTTSYNAIVGKLYGMGLLNEPAKATVEQAEAPRPNPKKVTKDSVESAKEVEGDDAQPGAGPAVVDEGAAGTGPVGDGQGVVQEDQAAGATPGAATAGTPDGGRLAGRGEGADVAEAPATDQRDTLTPATPEPAPPMAADTDVVRGETPYGAIPGAVSGKAGQNIPAPVTVPEVTPMQAAGLATTTKVAAPQTEAEIREAQRFLEQRRDAMEPLRNQQAQERLNQWWDKNIRGNKRIPQAEEISEIADSFAADATRKTAVDPSNSADKEAVLKLLQTPDKQLSGPAKHAKTYFKWFYRPIDGLEWMVSDAVLESAAERSDATKDMGKLDVAPSKLPKEARENLKGMPKRNVKNDKLLTAAEKRMQEGMSKRNAQEAMKWVEGNMSAPVQAKMREFVRTYSKASTDVGFDTGLATGAAPEQSITAGGKLRQTPAAAKGAKTGVEAAKAADVFGNARRIEAEENRAFRRMLEAEAAEARRRAKAVPTMPTMPDFLRREYASPEARALEQELHPAVKNRLQAGDLKGALRMLQYYAPYDRVARLAKMLSNYVDNVTVRYEENLAAPDNGDIVSGYFDFTNNVLGINTANATVETLLHEVVHAAVRTQIANKSTPEAARLRNLFNEAAPLLEGEYGATNIDEFLAEALSNPRFQEKLAKIHPKGQSATAWDRFLNTIGNFVRRLLGQPPKAIDLTGETAMDMVDELAEAVIKAPGAEPYVGVMHKLAVADGAKRALNAAAELTGKIGGPKTQEFREDFANQASRTLAQTQTGGTRVVLGFMGLQPVVDIARKIGIKGGMDLETAIRELDSFSMKADQETDAVLEVMQKWLSKFPNQKKRFDDLVMASTRNRVDPSHSFEKAKRMYEGTDKWPVYQRLRAEYDKLGPQGRELYVMMRNFYRDRYKRMHEAMIEKVEYTLGKDTEEAARVKQALITKFMDMGRIEPYFPMVRKGDYWLEYEMLNPDTGTTEPVKELYESPRAREQAARELDNIPGVVKDAEGKPVRVMYTSMDVINRTRTPDSLFVKDTVDLIRTAVAKKNMDAGLAADLQHDIVRMFIEALPETSFARSLQHRKDRLGAIQDSFEAFKLKGYTLGRQAVRHKYGHNIRAAADEIRQQGQYNNNQMQIDVINELVSRAEFAVNPPHGTFERFVQAANRTAFAYTLGLNVSSAVVNLSSVPIVVLPYLSGRHGFRASTRAINDAYRLFRRSGLSRTLELPGTYEGKTTTDVSTAPSIDNFFILGQDGKFRLRDDIPADMRSELEELAPLVEMAAQQGQLNRSIFYDSLGVESVGHQRTFADKVAAWSGGMFHFVERSNRQVTLMAAYKLELDRLRNRPKPEEMDMTEAERRTKAAEAAIYQATETNGGSTLATAPRWSQKGIGRVALMFKNYGLQIAYLQAKLARRLIWSDPDITPEQRKEAFKQLMGLQLSAGAFAGVAGVPIYGMISMVWDAWLGEDEEDADMITRRYLGEAAFKGLPSYLTGMDVSSRVGLVGLLIRENRYNTNPSDEERLVQNLGGPAWSTFTQVSRGVKEFGTAIREGDEEGMLRGIENMIPAAIRNFSKAARYAYEGGNIDTRRGDIIVGDLDTSSLLGQALGFAPMASTLQQDINRQNVRISRAVNDERSRLTKRYYLALRMGDREGAQDVLEDIRAFNEKVGQRYPEAVLTGEDINRSIKGHQRTTKEMTSGVSLAPNVREPLLEAQSEYGRGLPAFM